MVGAGSPRPPNVQADYGKLPLYFIPNQGQQDKKVKFYEKGSGHTTFFTENGVSFLLGGQTHRSAPTTPDVSLPFKGRLGGDGVEKQYHVGFQIASYNKSVPLVIDPVVVYSTYLGGSDSDFGRSIAVDSGGNAYITGFTVSTNFPTTNPIQGANAGGRDAFVTKIGDAAPPSCECPSHIASVTLSNSKSDWFGDDSTYSPIHTQH